MPRTLHARLDRSIRTRLHTLYEARDTLGVRRDAESLHALRIAIRRLHSLIAPLKDQPGLRRLARFDRRIKRVLTLTNPLRDAGVRAEWLDRLNYSRQRLGLVPPVPAELGACLQRCQLRQPGRIGRRLKKTGDKKLERILRRSVQRTERRLCKLLAKADLGSVGFGKQHEARLAAKRLRYQAELYADWLDNDRLASHLPVCKALQETLGDLRDLALLAQHVGHDPASQLAQALAVARQQAAAAAAQAWQAAHRHFRHA